MPQYSIQDKLRIVPWTKVVFGLMAGIGIVFLANQPISPHISYSFQDVASRKSIPTSTTEIFSFTPTVTVLPQASATMTVVAIQNSDAIPQKDFYLVIPKINIRVPVIAKVNGADKTAYLKALENGVAHYAGTSLPGEVGKVFIFGHSSYYRNLPGNYKKIFASLNNLNTGDEITMYYQNTEYVYRVFDKKIVLPDDTSVLQATENKTLALQTCWPPGTVEKRLVVYSEQVKP